MSDAAKKLYLAQSTLSYTVNQLEEELNVKLFIRDKKKLVITSDGKKLLQYADDVDSIINNAKNAFIKNRKLKISANNIGAAFLLSNYPKSKIESIDLFNMDERTLFENLTTGKIDIAVCDEYFMKEVNNRISPAKTQRISKFLICREQLGVLVPPSHSMYDRKFLQYEDLADEPLCVRIGNTAIKSWANAISEITGYGLKIDFEIDDYSYDLLRDSITYPELVCINSIVNYSPKHENAGGYRFVKINDRYSSRLVYMWYLQRNSDRIQPLIEGLKTYYSGDRASEAERE